MKKIVGLIMGGILAFGNVAYGEVIVDTPIEKKAVYLGENNLSVKPKTLIDKLKFKEVKSKGFKKYISNYGELEIYEKYFRANNLAYPLEKDGSLKLAYLQEAFGYEMLDSEKVINLRLSESSGPSFKLEGKKLMLENGSDYRGIIITVRNLDRKPSFQKGIKVDLDREFKNQIVKADRQEIYKIGKESGGILEIRTVGLAERPCPPV